MGRGLDRRIFNSSCGLCRRQPVDSWTRSLFTFALVQDVGKDVTKGQDALQLALFVNDHKPMDSRFADSVKDGVETIVQGTSIDARKVL